MGKVGIDLKKLIEDCSQCDNELSVSEVTEIVRASFSVLYNEGDVLKEAEQTLGEQKFNELITSIYATILGNVLTNSHQSADQEIN